MPEVRSPSVNGSPEGAEGWLASVRLFTWFGLPDASRPEQVFQMSGGKLPAGGSCSSPLLLMQPGWNGLRSCGMASGVLAKPLTVWATAPGPWFVHVTVSPAMIAICEGANALMDNHGLFEPLTPAAACHVFVPSGFDASAGLLTRSSPANQARSASY